MKYSIRRNTPRRWQLGAVSSNIFFTALACICTEVVCLESVTIEKVFAGSAIGTNLAESEPDSAPLSRHRTRLHRFESQHRRRKRLGDQWAEQHAEHDHNQEAKNGILTGSTKRHSSDHPKREKSAYLGSKESKPFSAPFSTKMENLQEVARADKLRQLNVLDSSGREQTIRLLPNQENQDAKALDEVRSKQKQHNEKGGNKNHRKATASDVTNDVEGYEGKEKKKGDNDTNVDGIIGIDNQLGAKEDTQNDTIQGDGDVTLLSVEMQNTDAEINKSDNTAAQSSNKTKKVEDVTVFSTVATERPWDDDDIPNDDGVLMREEDTVEIEEELKFVTVEFSLLVDPTTPVAARDLLQGREPELLSSVINSITAVFCQETDFYMVTDEEDPSRPSACDEHVIGRRKRLLNQSTKHYTRAGKRRRTNNADESASDDLTMLLADPNDAMVEILDVKARLKAPMAEDGRLRQEGPLVITWLGFAVQFDLLSIGKTYDILAQSSPTQTTPAEEVQRIAHLAILERIADGSLLRLMNGGTSDKNVAALASLGQEPSSFGDWAVVDPTASLPKQPGYYQAIVPSVVSPIRIAGFGILGLLTCFFIVMRLTHKKISEQNRLFEESSPIKDRYLASDEQLSKVLNIGQSFSMASPALNKADFPDILK